MTLVTAKHDRGEPLEHAVRAVVPPPSLVDDDDGDVLVDETTLTDSRGDRALSTPCCKDVSSRS
jgi:hypothetical protein